MDGPARFHLSLVTEDLERQRAFYVRLLGCRPGRSTAEFEDFDFFGHQVTFHRRAKSLDLPYESFHFGAIISTHEFDSIAARLTASNARFVIAPVEQSPGTAEARRKLVVLDPSGYAVELKCYRDASRALVQAPGYPRIIPTEK